MCMSHTSATWFTCAKSFSYFRIKGPSASIYVGFVPFYLSAPPLCIRHQDEPGNGCSLPDHVTGKIH